MYCTPHFVVGNKLIKKYCKFCWNCLSFCSKT